MKRTREPSSGPLVVRKRLASSHDVFSRFLGLNEDGTVDARKIFSQECFKYWLSTRPGEIKHPERSFQRTLYAHIKGADNRKPFPEPVEAALLKLLRGGPPSKTDSDYSLAFPRAQKMWQAICGEKHLRVGQKGFKKKGYHEQKREALLEASKAQDSVNTTNSSAALPSNSLNILNNGRNLYAQSTAQQSLHNLAMVNKTSEGEIPFAVYQQTMNTYSSPGFLEDVKARGIDIFSPQMKRFLGQPFPQEDPRFSASFMFPSVEQCHFETNRLTAQLVFDGSRVCIAENTTASVVFGGSVLNLNIVQLAASHASSAFKMLTILPLIAGSPKEFWTRDILLKRDGTKGVFLIRTSLLPPCLVLNLQDHSDIYRDILSLPDIV